MFLYKYSCIFLLSPGRGIGLGVHLGRDEGVLMMMCDDSRDETDSLKNTTPGCKDSNLEWKEMIL